jgi:hypothetical protein
MKTYKVKIKNSDKPETIKARSELEAKVKYCEKNNLNYRHLAGKLEITQGSKNIIKNNL